MLLGYARVSTAEQQLEPQLDALIAAGVEPGRIYTDKISGAKSARPGLEMLRKALRSGDVLVIVRLDRLGRSLGDLIAISAELDAIGVHLRSLAESIDTTTPGGRLIFHLFGAVAEFERAIIRERTAAGLKSARERGRRGGRKKKLTGVALKAARLLWADPALTVAEVVEQTKVSRKTLYRTLGPREAAAGPAVTP